MHFYRRFGIGGLIWVIIGIIVACDKGYITFGFIKHLVSVLLAIILWFLPLIGISLHVH